MKMMVTVPTAFGGATGLAGAGSPARSRSTRESAKVVIRITALEITEVRGVNTSGVLNTLLERHLIKIVGRKQVVGRPFMYATTKEFLIRFGLNELSDLPKVEDMAEALGLEAPLLVEQTPAEDMLPLEEPEAEPPNDTGGTVH